MAVKVAIAGATGNLGPAVLNALLEAGFQVVVLSRKDSSSTDSLPQHPNQTITKVDYFDIAGLTTVLEATNVVVSTLASKALDTQKPLIDASVAAGLKRYLPSDFGSDLHNPLNQKLPVFKGKVDTHHYLEKLAAENSHFSYTYTYNNAFLDWGLKVGFTVNPKEHSATLWDGGDVSISMTTLATIGKAVVAIINNLDATKNKTLYYHDTAITLNQIVDIVKSIDGKEWTTKVEQTKDIEQKAYAELQKPDGSVGGVMVGFIRRACFSKDHNPNFTDGLSNELLGLPVFSREGLVEVIKSQL